MMMDGTTWVFLVLFCYPLCLQVGGEEVGVGTELDTEAEAWEGYEGQGLVHVKTHTHI